MIADLHLHSSYSDGSDTVKELLNQVIMSKVNIFALTDHDTVSGCKEMNDIVPSNLKFIPGVELTCREDDIKCHILGYGCDYNNKDLLSLIDKGKSLRREKLETRIEYLRTVWNIVLTEKEKEWLYSRKSVVKTHVANILVNRGLASNNVSAMKKYLDGCKTGNTRFTITEALKSIISAGGIPVWAHPLGGEGEKHINEQEFLPKLEKMITFGIKGLECFYSRYNSAEANFLAKCAEKNNLFITGGSDYHGTNKDIPIGRLDADDMQISANMLSLLKMFDVNLI